MKSSPVLASSLILAMTSADAQTRESRVVFESNDLPAGIVELNQDPPQALVDLQQCVRQRFSEFALENQDGTVSYMFEQPQSDGTLIYDFTFHSDLEERETYLTRYKQLPPEIFHDQVVRPEDPNFNTYFEYPISLETLLNNGYINAPGDFLDHFQRRLGQWSNLCDSGVLNSVDLPSLVESFWNDALALHERARRDLEQCLAGNLSLQTVDILQETLAEFGDLEAYPEFGFEDPNEMTFQL